jgi:hypothetical protein
LEQPSTKSKKRESDLLESRGTHKPPAEADGKEVNPEGETKE